MPLPRPDGGGGVGSVARCQEGDDEKPPVLRVGGMELEGDPIKPERRPPKPPLGGIELSGASLPQSGLD